MELRIHVFFMVVFAIGGLLLSYFRIRAVYTLSEFKFEKGFKRNLFNDFERLRLLASYEEGDLQKEYKLIYKGYLISLIMIGGSLFSYFMDLPGIIAYFFS